MSKTAWIFQAVFLYYSLISGRPAMLVSRDKNPARKELPITIFQSTDEKAADVPMVANIACAVVLTALMDAALSHFKILFNIFYLLPFGFSVDGGILMERSTDTQ